MLNVCLLNDSFPPQIDGVANTVVNYASVLQKRREKSVVVTPEYPGAVDDYPFPVIRYPSINTTRLVGYRTGFPLESHLFRRFEDEGCNILHSHCPAVSTILARMIREKTDVPLILTYHTKFDIDIRNAIKSELLQEAAVKLLIHNVEACDEVWAVSRGAGENLRSLGYRGEYRVMENGVDLPKGRLSREECQAQAGNLPIEKGVPVYLFVGRLMWYKGIRLILEGLAALKAEGKRFSMLFVGTGGDEAEIRRETEASGLADCCRFLGAIREREKLRAIYSSADILLFPSAFDTFGLVVREAAACGTPALLIRGSCAADGVKDGFNGLLTDESAEGLHKALAAVYGHEDRLREMGSHAMESLYTSWEDSVAIACERYEALIEQKKTSAKKRTREGLKEKYWELLSELEGFKHYLRGEKHEK